MTLGLTELARAREAVAAALEALGLEAFLFEVEPREGDTWVLRVECAVAEGWERVEVPVPRAALLEAAQGMDADLKARLGPALAACRRGT